MFSLLPADPEEYLSRAVGRGAVRGRAELNTGVQDCCCCRPTRVLATRQLPHILRVCMYEASGDFCGGR
jgi:hypothetical protein